MFIKKILPNGLRLILVPQPKSLASTVLVLVEAGSEYETKETNGLSHFLEHMVFKGTERRASSQIISSELDALGAEYNAFTGQEYTGYWAKAQSYKLPQLIDIVSDLTLNPVFNANEIEKERGVIIEEINMYEDTPMRKIHSIFSELLYGDQPAGWDIAGTKENIRTLQRDDFVAYRGARYVAPGTTVVIAGEFSPKAVGKTITKLFGGLPKKKAAAKIKTAVLQTRPAVSIKFKESDQTHIVLGVRAFDIFDKRRHALQVLADVVGGGMSSRLFHRVRSELGAAYYVHANGELFFDHGQFTVSAGADNARAEIVVTAIIHELKRMASELVPKAELQKAKDHMVGGLILGLETSDEVAGFYGGQEIITRKIVTPEEVVKQVQKVTAAQIRALAREIFVDKGLNLALIGPYKEPGRFEKLLNF
jgi:predicted Zn-dependent peptidase